MSEPTTNELRSRGDLEGAVWRFVAACRSPELSRDGARYRRFIRGHLIEHQDGCLVLRWAAKMFADGKRDQCDETIKNLRKSVALYYERARPLLEAWLDLIEVLASGKREELEPKSDADNRLRSAILKHIVAANDAWSYTRTPQNEKIECEQLAPADCDADLLRGSSFLAALPNDAYRRMFHSLAKQHGWTHPGLLLAGHGARYR